MCEPYYGERTRHGEVEYLIDPYINALYATPRIALVPLLILWLGLDTQMKIFVVFLGSFFPYRD